MAARRRTFWLSVGRVEALTDGIFAISMTLLVLSLAVPNVSTAAGSGELWRALSHNSAMFLDYALSFFLLANFWIGHHRQFRFVKRMNEPFLWMNILALMLIALVPFSTEVMSRYDPVMTAAWLFEANLLGIGAVYFFMWMYATSDYRLVEPEEISRKAVTIARRTNLVLPAVSLLAMGLALITPSNSELAYLLIPVAVFAIRRRPAAGG